ncbi:uncharacterized protein [Haliotis asinina]|uniref:uncharacterized protein n=1 Tax=Haliotis asinina TaxID=109174 RepID=UPI003531F404
MEGVNVAVSMMKVCCLHQEGQRHYNQGNVQGAIDSFRSALKKAKSINERHIENICTHNLASVYAAKGDKEYLEELLQSLPDQFIDDIMQEEGNNIIYLRAVANRSVSHYEQALKVVSDSRTQTYLLEQLVKQLSEEQDSRKKIKYLEQLKEGFRVKRNDMRRFQVMCQLARLYIRDSSTEDAQKVLRELKKEVDMTSKKFHVYKE